MTESILTASNLIIRGNLIHDGHHTESEPLHADGIQGWTLKGNINKNVTIESNTIIKTGDSKVSYMQGISIFDGKWDGLTVVNNVVVTNHWHGIALYGVKNAMVANNTVVASDPGVHPTWIMVTKGKDGVPSSNAIVRNNIVTILNCTGDNVIVDHNIASKSITISEGGKTKITAKAGIVGLQNKIVPGIYNTLVDVDNVKALYDLHLRTGSPAIGAGNPKQAPLMDIVGEPRRVPMDIGAYAWRERY